MEEPNEEKFISMCMECEQTFYDEHIYKIHACYPIDSMVEPSLDYQMLPIKEEKIEEEEQIDFLCNEQIEDEIDIKEEKMDAEDEPEADSSESELVIANVQSLQNVQQERGNYFSNISNYFYESYDKAGNQIYILVTFDSESVHCRQKSTNITSILVASLRYLGRKLQNSLQMLTPSNI